MVQEGGEGHQSERRSVHNPTYTSKPACQDLQEDLHGGAEGNQYLHGGHGEGRKDPGTRVGLQSARQE